MNISIETMKSVLCETFRSESEMSMSHVPVFFDNSYGPSTVIAPLATLLWRIEPGFGLTSIHWFQLQKLRICRSWCNFSQNLSSSWKFWSPQCGSDEPFLIQKQNTPSRSCFFEWSHLCEDFEQYRSHYRSSIRIKTSIGDIAMRYPNIIIHQCLWIE